MLDVEAILERAEQSPTIEWARKEFLDGYMSVEDLERAIEAALETIAHSDEFDESGRRLDSVGAWPPWETT